MEAGAFDGATDSNTLHFELAHQWSGLLVEPVKGYYQKKAIVSSHPKYKVCFVRSHSTYKVVPYKNIARISNAVQVTL